jgi:hypothetical protein
MSKSLETGKPPVRLHITGCHRSGTTLITEMIAACFEYSKRCEHEQSVFEPIEHEEGLYLSKKPSDITHIKRILLNDPKLHVIYMLRDPRSVITSIHPSKADIYFASFERWQRYEIAAKALKGHPRFLEIRYEALISDPDREQQKIAKTFTFLNQDHQFSNYEKHAKASKKAEISLKGLRPITNQNLSSWQNHWPRIAFQIEKYPMLKQIVREYGYETTDSWLDPIKDVKPRHQAYGESTPPIWQQLETDLRYYLKSRTYLKRSAS